MLLSFGVLLILCGLAVMTFGLFLFYAWLPILYALFGFDIGLLLGQWLSGEVGVFAFVLGVIGAVIFFSATYALEPYRRVLIGFSGGALLTLSLAYLLGLDHLIGGVFGTLLVV
jgi:predicted esterase